MPVGKLVKCGVWEKGNYIGVIIYGMGANKDLLKPFDLTQSQGCELVRIALNRHENSVSRMISISLKMIKKFCPGIKLIVSFADKEQGHYGGIYQATNWIYTGVTNSADEYLYKSKRWHGRAFRKSFGSHKKFIGKGLKIVKGSQKHRYLMPLTEDLRKRILPMSKPYPKACKVSDGFDQKHSGGLTPTCTLQG